MQATTTVPIIDVAGTHVEIGAAVGESLRDGLRRVAELYRAGMERAVGWERVLELSRLMQPCAERQVPHCMDELRGMASGSGVPLDVLFSMNASQETRFLAGLDGARPDAQDDDEGCTSLAVGGEATLDGHVLLAHNEDAGPLRGELNYVVRARPVGRPAFVGFAYSGCLLYQGFNECGIGSVGNALYATDIRPGTPKLLAYRDVLDATFLEDAVRRTIRPTRANGNNHLVANQHGEIFDVEVTGGDCALIPARGDSLAHTNHITDARLQHLEWGDLLNSRLRLTRVERLLARQHGRVTVDSIFEILTDHSNFPKSVCKHLDESHNPGVQTIAGLVIDLTAGILHVRAGQPCETPTVSVTLAA